MNLAATYTLRRKDLPLVRFALYAQQEYTAGIEQTVYQISITEVNEKAEALFPVALRKNLTASSLLAWIKRRKVPRNRRFAAQIRHAIADDQNPLHYVDVSYALSLNDAFWITNDAIPALWKDFSLYHHPFDKSLAYVAFTGCNQKVSGFVSSPELTTSGMLKKYWSHRESGICLIKGDDFIQTNDGRSQATMEFYAVQVAEKMGFRHISYDLEEFHHPDGEQEIVCICKLFTSEDIGFVNAYDYFRDKGINLEKADLSRLKVQKDMEQAYGAETYQDLMVFDSLICNRDRHLGNFGYLVDNNTGEYISPAPIFDNGFSLLYGAARGSMADIPTYIKTIEGKYLPFDLQAQLFIQPRHAAKLRKLLHFKLQKHPRCNVSDTCLKKMSEMVQLRAKTLLEIYDRREMSL